jgi:hypothetical protein
MKSSDSGTWKKMVEVARRAMRTTQPPSQLDRCQHRLPREHVEDHLALLLAAGY